jgi:hypothetical protein
MPRIRHAHLPARRLPREQDPGYLIAVARAAGFYVRNAHGGRVELQHVRTRAMVFAGTVPEAVAFVRALHPSHPQR